MISLGKATQVLVSESRTIRCKRKKDHIFQFRRMPKGQFRLEIVPVSLAPLVLKDKKTFFCCNITGRRVIPLPGNFWEH